MGVPRFEPVLGVVDGVNKIFRTNLPYGEGSLACYLNGQLLRKEDDDGWAELDPWRGVIQYKAAPMPGDIPQAFYIDTGTQGVAENRLEKVVVTLIEIETVSGKLRDSGKLVGMIEEKDRMLSKILSKTGLVGKVEELEQMRATLCTCG